MATYTGTQWIELIVLGGLAGALGQGARCIIGLKKLGDQATAEGKTREELFDAARLVTSFLIGFVAGAFAAIFASPDLAKIQIEQFLAFASAGYAGADAIEAVISRIEPNSAAKDSTGTDSSKSDYLG